MLLYRIAEGHNLQSNQLIFEHKIDERPLKQAKKNLFGFDVAVNLRKRQLTPLNIWLCVDRQLDGRLIKASYRSTYISNDNHYGQLKQEVKA